MSLVTANDTTKLTGNSLSTLVDLFRARANYQRIFNAEVIAQSNKLLKEGIVKSILTALRSVCGKSADNADFKEATVNATKQSEILFYISYNTQLLDNEITELIELVKQLSEKLDSSKLDSDACDSDSLLHALVNVELALICALQQSKTLLSRTEDYSSLEQAQRLATYNQCEKFDIGSKDWRGVAESWLCIGARGFTCMMLAIFRHIEVERDNQYAHEVKHLLIKASLHRGYSFLRESIVPVVQGIALFDHAKSLMMMESIALVLDSLARMFTTGQYRGNEMRDDFASELFYQRVDSGRHGTKGPEDYDTFATFLHVLSDVIELYPAFGSVFWQPSGTATGGRPAPSYAEEFLWHPFLVKSIELCGHYDFLQPVGARFLATIAKTGTPLASLAMYRFVSEKLLWRWTTETLDRAYDILDKSDDGLTATGVDLNGGGLKMGLAKTLQMPSSFNTSLPLETDVVLRPDDIAHLHAVLQLLTALAGDTDVAEVFVNDFQLIDRLFVFISSAVIVDVKAACFDCLRGLCCHDRSYVARTWQLCEKYNLFPSRMTAAGLQDKGFAWEFAEIEVRTERFPMTMSFLALLTELLRHGAPLDLGVGYRVPGIATYVDFVVEEVLLKAQGRLYDRSLEEVDGLGQRWKVTALALEVIAAILASYRLETLNDAAVASIMTEDHPLVADFVDQNALYVIDRQETLALRPKSPGFTLLASILSNSPLTTLLLNVVIHLHQTYIEQQAVDFLSALLATAKAKYFNDYSAHPMYTPNGGGGGGGGSGGGALVVFDASSSSSVGGRIKSWQNYTLQRTNSVFWIERTLAASLWILSDVAAKEATFFRLFERQHRPVTIQRREAGRLLQTPVTPTTLSAVLVGHDATLSLLQLVTQRFAYVPAQPTIEVLALRLVQHVATTAPDYQLSVLASSSAGDGSDGGRGGGGEDARRARDLPSIVRKFDAILLSDGDDALAATQIDAASGRYVLVADRHATAPLVWSLAAGAASPSSSSSSSATTTTTHAVRAEVLTLFLKALQPGRSHVVQQLLGVHVWSQSALVSGSVGGGDEAPRPCLSSLLALLNPKGHQLLLHAPQEAVDCYELIYRLCASDATSVATSTLAQLRAPTVDFFRSQFAFFALLLQIRHRVAVDMTAVANAFAWYWKTLALDLYRRMLHDDATAIVASLVQTVFGGADDTVGGGSGSGAFVHVRTTLQWVVEQLGRAAPAAAMPLGGDVPLVVTRDAKGGTGFGVANGFRRGTHVSSEPPEFATIALQDAVAWLQDVTARSGGGGAAATTPSLDAVVTAVTTFNAARRHIAAMQHVTLALQQVFELCFLTPCFTVVQAELGYDGANDLVRDLVVPLLAHVGPLSDVDGRSTEAIVDIVLLVVQSLDAWTGASRVSTMVELTRSLFATLQLGSSRGGAHHAKVALALLHLRRFLATRVAVAAGAPSSSSSSSSSSASHRHQLVADAPLAQLASIWNFQGDVNAVVERLLDVAVLHPTVRWQIVALDLLKSFYEDLSRTDAFRGKDIFSRFLVSRGQLANVLRAVFPLDESHLDDHVALLAAFADVLACIIDELPADLVDDVVGILRLVAQKQDFESLQMQLSYGGGAAAAADETAVRQRKTTLLRGFLRVTALLTHALHSVALNHQLVDVAMTFYQRNAQTFASIVRLQNQPLLTTCLETTLAFVATVTAKSLSLAPFGDNGGSGAALMGTTMTPSMALNRAPTVSDVWGAGSELLLQDVFKALQLLGDAGLQYGISGSYGGGGSDSTALLSFAGSDVLAFARVFGKMAEALVLREEPTTTATTTTTTTTPTAAAAGRYLRMAEVVRAAEHCSVFLRAVSQSTSTTLKVGGLHVLPIAELLQRIVALPAVAGWVHHCLEAIVFLAKDTSQALLSLDNEAPMVRPVAFAETMTEVLTRVVENLACVVYCIVDLHQEANARSGQRERVALDLRSIQAVEQLTRDSLALPPHSFTRTVTRWLKEVIESR